MHCLDSLIPSGERGLDGFVCQSWVVTVVRGRDVGWVVGQVGGVVSWMGWLRWGRTGRGWLGLVWIVGFVRIVGFVLRIDGWRTGVGLLGWLGGVLVRRRRPCIEGKLERGGFWGWALGLLAGVNTTLVSCGDHGGGDKKSRR